MKDDFLLPSEHGHKFHLVKMSHIFAAGCPDIDPCCFNIAVAKNICQFCNISFDIIHQFTTFINGIPVA